MFERLQEKLTGKDALIRAMQRPDRENFAQVFARSNVLFLQLPPGCENGFDPHMSQDELLARIKSAAKDLSQRQQFTPFCRVRPERKSLLLFTEQKFVQQFVQAYVREAKRLMQFEVLGISGQTALRLFEGVDSVIFNPETRQEYEVSAEDMDMLLYTLRRSSPVVGSEQR
jgi:hypothetical protein